MMTQTRHWFTLGTRFTLGTGFTLDTGSRLGCKCLPKVLSFGCSHSVWLCRTRPTLTAKGHVERLPILYCREHSRPRASPHVVYNYKYITRRVMQNVLRGHLVNGIGQDLDVSGSSMAKIDSKMMLNNFGWTYFSCHFLFRILVKEVFVGVCTVQIQLSKHQNVRVSIAGPLGACVCDIFFVVRCGCNSSPSPQL